MSSSPSPALLSGPDLALTRRLSCLGLSQRREAVPPRDPGRLDWPVLAHWVPLLSPGFGCVVCLRIVALQLGLRRESLKSRGGHWPSCFLPDPGPAQPACPTGGRAAAAVALASLGPAPPAPRPRPHCSCACGGPGKEELTRNGAALLRGKQPRCRTEQRSCKGKSFPETLQTHGLGQPKTFGDQNGSQGLEVIRCFSLLSPSLKFCEFALPCRGTMVLFLCFLWVLRSITL